MDDGTSIADLDFERLIAREWLVTNGIGGYASSTIPGLNTPQVSRSTGSCDGAAGTPAWCCSPASRKRSSGKTAMPIWPATNIPGRSFRAATSFCAAST